ncbi:MAG: acyltransferase, partial [Paracoccaceae bacterium]
MFFVISGYLITSIIVSEMKQNRFSVGHFYERRARRILPALFFVMLATTPFAWLWLMPDDLQDFSESLFATALFYSNFFFWLQTGYFDTAAELKPMLHTWSLAVEEQYYILFPLILILVWRLGKSAVITALAGLFVLSLWYAVSE